MITLNTDMYLLCSLFNISYKKIASDYSGMSIEQIMKKEAESGNTAAAKFDQAILSDPYKLIELFKLNDPNNKFIILRSMNQQDLQELLPMLKDDDLIQGLQFFNKDKLLDMMGDLPKEQLIKLTLQMIPPEQLMQLMPEDQLNKVLTSTDLDKNDVLKFLPMLKPEILAQMYEGSTGLPAPIESNANSISGNVNYNKEQLLNLITDLPADKFQDALLSMPPANKQAFVLQLAKNDNKLFESIDSDAYISIINNNKDKQDIIRYANVISSDQLVKMVQQLPKDLMSVVLTQIDTKKFADELLSKFKNIISEICAG